MTNCLALLANGIWAICSGAVRFTLPPVNGSVGTFVTCAVAFGPGTPDGVQLFGSSQVVAAADQVETWARTCAAGASQPSAAIDKNATGVTIRRRFLGTTNTFGT